MENVWLNKKYNFHIKHMLWCSLSSTISCHASSHSSPLAPYFAHCVDSHDLQLVVSYLIMVNLYLGMYSMEVPKNCSHSYSLNSSNNCSSNNLLEA